MRKIKQCLSAFLAAAMVLSVFPATTNAAETQKKGWVLEKSPEKDENRWRYYNNEGKEKIGFKLIEEKEKRWYYFDEDGDMVSDAWIPYPSERKITGWAYANPDGVLVDGTWAILNSGGTCTHSNSAEMDLSEENRCKWYYFDKSTETQPGLLVTGKVYDVDGSSYAFDGLEGDEKPSATNGMMLSRKWVKIDGDKIVSVFEESDVIPGNIGEPLENLRYFMGDGSMAKDKYLYLGGVWYDFDKEGVARKRDPQDPPAYPIDSVTPIQDHTLTAYVGQDYPLEFQLATANNAQPDDPKPINKTYREKDHDIWVPVPQKGVDVKRSISIDQEKGIVQIWFNSTYIGKDEITIYVDGKPSDPYNINVVMPPVDTEGEDVDTTPGEALGSILTNIKGSAEAAGVNSLKTAYKGFGEGTKTALKSEWINKKEDLSNAADAYAFNYRILEEEPSVSADAQNQLRSGEVTLVGGALNVPVNDNEPARSVQLTVDSAAVPNLRETFANTVAFDISLVINGKEQPDPELPVIISMPLPYGISSNVSKNNLALYNIHDGAEKEEIEDFTIANGIVTFVTDKFSTYVFAQKAQTVNPPSPGQSGGSGSGSGSGSSSGSSGGSTVVSAKTGAWKQNETGWWYEYSDGTYPKSGWMQLPYNNRTDWYYFDAEGYMMTGWIQDGGLWYYLNPVSDGTMGAMMTGWIQDGGLWYYLNPVSGGPQGSMSTGWVQDGGQWYYLSNVSDGTRGHMLASTTTPDGCQVGADGTWIQ